MDKGSINVTVKELDSKGSGAIIEVDSNETIQEFIDDKVYKAFG